MNKQPSATTALSSASMSCSDRRWVTELVQVSYQSWKEFMGTWLCKNLPLLAAFLLKKKSRCNGITFWSCFQTQASSDLHSPYLHPPTHSYLCLPSLAPLLFLQTTRLCCSESAANDRSFLIINHSWLRSQAGPHCVSSRKFMGFEKKELCTQGKMHISCNKNLCQGKKKVSYQEAARNSKAPAGFT